MTGMPELDVGDAPTAVTGPPDLDVVDQSTTIVGHVSDVEEVAWLVDRLAVLVGDRDHLAGLDADAVRARIGCLRRLAGLTEAGLAAAVGALDQVGGVAADGAPSAAEWLKANLLRSGRDAARTSRLAQAMDDLPQTTAALASGRMSADSADAIVGAARDGRLGAPAVVEAQLLEVASSSSPERLRRAIRKRQQLADHTRLVRDERRQHALRSVTFARHDDGMWHLHGRLTDEVGTRLRTALDAFDISSDQTRGRPDKRLADALDTMTFALLDHGLAPGTGGTARPHLSVLVDLDVLTADLVDPDCADPDAPGAAPGPLDAVWAGLPSAETTWGGLLSPQAVRRIACDAGLSRVVLRGDSQVLDVGRTTRDWSGPQRRAVNARDRGCRGPSCDRPIAWTHIHHLRWWRNHGPTAVDNGLALCHSCHHLVHDRNWTVDLDPTTAAATWTSPTGTVTVTEPHRDPPITTRRPPDTPLTSTVRRRR